MHKTSHKGNVVKIQVEAKSPKKRASKSSKPRISIEKVQVEMQPVLVENFIALQKVMINLSQKFENLNVQTSKLLELFETSAKTLAKKDFKLGNEANLESQKQVMDKINTLSEQNKIIAKGLTMLHERQEEVQPATQMMMPPAQEMQIGMPRTNAPARPAAPEEEYKRSASFRPLK